MNPPSHKGLFANTQNAYICGCIKLWQSRGGILLKVQPHTGHRVVSTMYNVALECPLEYAEKLFCVFMQFQADILIVH